MKPDEILSYKVNCAYSNTGKHFIHAGFSKERTLVYLSCDCEKIHGKTRAVSVEEVAPGVSCYHIKHLFIQFFELSREKNKFFDRYSNEVTRLSSAIRSYFPRKSCAYETLGTYITHEYPYNLRAARHSSKEPMPIFTKEEALGRLFNKIIFKATEDPKNPYKVSNPKVATIRRYEISDRVKDTYIIDIGYYNLVKRVNGVWEDPKSLIEKVTSLPFIPGNNFTHEDPSGTTWCAYCKKRFARITKHTAGNDHKQKVEEVWRVAFSATSSTGLKMLSNPKYRHLFR